MRKTHILLPISLLLVFFGFSSCHEVEETIANVVVLNDLGSPVQGATVRLYAFGSVDEDFVGEPRLVSFNFSSFYVEGQAGFAVLDIEATKASLYGTGLIKIEEELTNEATIFIE